MMSKEKMMSKRIRGKTKENVCVWEKGGGEGGGGGHPPRGWASAPGVGISFSFSRTRLSLSHVFRLQSAHRIRNMPSTNPNHTFPTHHPIGGMGRKSMAGVCRSHESYTPSKTCIHNLNCPPLRPSYVSPAIRINNCQPDVREKPCSWPQRAHLPESHRLQAQLLIYIPRPERKKVCNLPSGMGPSTRP